jgi:hypothetical protein
MGRFTLYLSVLLLITSCGTSKEDKQKKELEKLALEVMAVHDRSMPEHGKLFGYKKKLLAINETLSDSPEKTQLLKCLEDLEKADEDMMDWMHHYKTPEDFMPFEEKKAYYIEQKKIIEEVEKLTQQVIEQAKQYIAKYPVTQE